MLSSYYSEFVELQQLEETKLPTYSSSNSTQSALNVVLLMLRLATWGGVGGGGWWLVVRGWMGVFVVSPPRER